jgi:hypothetical protein
MGEARQARQKKAAVNRAQPIKQRYTQNGSSHIGNAA